MNIKAPLTRPKTWSVKIVWKVSKKDKRCTQEQLIDGLAELPDDNKKCEWLDVKTSQRNRVVSGSEFGGNNFGKQGVRLETEVYGCPLKKVEKAAYIMARKIKRFKNATVISIGG